MKKKPKIKKIKPISFRQTLFWDVNPKTIDPQKNSRYVIERILEFGNDTEVRWMAKYYSPAVIKKTFRTSRGVLHEKTKALWSLVLR